METAGGPHSHNRRQPTSCAECVRIGLAGRATGSELAGALSMGKLSNHRRQSMASEREAKLAAKVAGIIRRLEGLCAFATQMRLDMAEDAKELRRALRGVAPAKPRRA